MTEDAEQLYLNAASALLGLPIQPAHRREVEAAFKTLVGQAKLITDFQLPPETEAAPRFTA